MASRSVNKVILVGNLTREPELRYTPQSAAVASFSVATNREWKLDNGETKQVADFHNCVAWNKLAEICANLLKKGTKVYVEGRLQTRDWQAEDGSKRYKTEVVIDDMVILKQPAGYEYEDNSNSTDEMKASTPDNSSTDSTNTGDEIDLDDLNLDDVLGEAN